MSKYSDKRQRRVMRDVAVDEAAAMAEYEQVSPPVVERAAPAAVTFCVAKCKPHVTIPHGDECFGAKSETGMWMVDFKDSLNKRHVFVVSCNSRDEVYRWFADNVGTNPMHVYAIVSDATAKEILTAFIGRNK